MFRRDNLPPPPGTIIAEFGSGSDALHFARSKGEQYTVTPGINLPFAVRVALPHQLSQHSPIRAV